MARWSRKGIGFVAKSFRDANAKKPLIIKLAILAATILVVLITSLVVREHVLAETITTDTAWIKFVPPIMNRGVAWSSFSNASEGGIVVLQLLPVVIGLCVLVFLRSWWTLAPVTLIAIGGLANIIDRLTVDNYNGMSFGFTVVDYLQFDGRTEQFNLPDAFIFIGLGLCVLSIAWWVIKQFLDDKKQREVPRAEAE